MQVTGRELPARANLTTSDNPWPLRLLTSNVRQYVDKMSELWVEGQVVEYSPRGSSRMSFFTLRDVEEDVSMRVTAFSNSIASAGEGFQEGARVIVRVKPSFWEQRGSLSLMAREIKLDGIGSLLAEVERLRARLASEGLFSEARKRPLPFLPRRIGLICGREAKAKDDVLRNAYLRWPSARFEIREVAVQGRFAVDEVTAALAELSLIELVDVIVIARGGGSVEDLLPFSDEKIVRAAAASPKPVVSAIGHEGDAPLLDLVSDYRASTPTDAARKVVPDFREEQRHVAHFRSQMLTVLSRLLRQESEFLSVLTSRPVLQRPMGTVEQQRAGLDQAQTRIRTAAMRALGTEQSQIAQLGATLTALSPIGTLDRGYAILRTSGGQILRSTAEMQNGMLIEGMLASGTFVANVVGTNAKGFFINQDQTPKEER